MAAQTYANHRRTVPVFHFFLLPLLLAIFIGAVVNLIQSFSRGWAIHFAAALIFGLSLAAIFTTVLARIFALKAQDRAIRAEENLRHFALTGRLLDPRLTPLQIVALRFAPDAEFPALSERAASESMKPDEIKRAIANWRPDEYRA